MDVIQAWSLVGQSGVQGSLALRHLLLPETGIVAVRRGDGSVAGVGVAALLKEDINKTWNPNLDLNKQIPNLN